MVQLKTMGLTLGAIALAVLAGCQSSSQADQNGGPSPQAAQPNVAMQSDRTVSADTATPGNTDANTAATPISNQQFVAKAAQAGLAEVQLGQLAEQKAASNEVKQYAQQMVLEHTQANNQLKQLANQKSLTVPQSLDQQHQTAKANLAKLSGVAFDRAYMDLMKQDHAKVISLFQQEASHGQDASLKNWAATTLPKLQKHSQMAQTISASLNNAANK